MTRQARSGGRQTVDYRARLGTGDPNATSAERAAQSAFGSIRAGGFQLASKGAAIEAAFGDTIAIENTSTATADRPWVKLPRITAGDVGKTVVVVAGAGSMTAPFKASGTDKVNLGTSGTVTSYNLAATIPGFMFYAVGPTYGWRLFAMIV
jgi:hypothetical protein